MIEIGTHIRLDESELEESFVRSSGPGGQNVNKLSTAVQLRLDVARAPGIPDWVKARLRTVMDGQPEKHAEAASKAARSSGKGEK